MELSVKQFGPFASASVKPRDLNVFIGPNNSGKSMMAMLAHAAVLATPPAYMTSSRPGRWTPDAPDLADEDAANFQEYIRLLGRKPRTSRKMPEGLRSILNDFTEKSLTYYAQNIRREVERAFGSRLSDLSRVEARRQPTRIVVRSSRPRWSVEVRYARRRSREGPTRFATEYDVTVPTSTTTTVAEAANAATEWTEDEDVQWIGNLRAKDFVGLFLNAFLWRLFGDFPSMSYYLPAARSGVMQSHRALASSVISQAPLAGIRRVEVPRMTGVIGDFLSQLVRPERDQPGPLNDVAEFLEEKIVHGHVLLRPERTGYPEILYENEKGHKFRLHRTSSMISELAPLIIYLRYLVDPGESLVIEEPESSLHPETQVRLAEAIALLVSRSVDVTITTHSDYFLNTLNNLIQVGTLADAQAEGDGASPTEPFLHESQVRAYLFRRRPSGTSVTPLPVSARYGIPEAEFARVAEALYNASVDLDERF